jgi:basic amino acid/polyamine antiporter, APA family
VSARAETELVRAIGRWSLTGFVINAIIGSGVFGLPDDISRLVGAAAPLAYVLAALGIGVVMSCFAEVASRFTAAGGPYLYAREAFGRFAGVQMGWFAAVVRIAAAAANANLFVVYLGAFWPSVTDPWPRAIVLLLLFGFLAAVNIRGVRPGARVSDGLTFAKLVPIAVFVAVGAWAVGSQIVVGSSQAPAADWLQAVLALVFAFGGFEVALMPMSEARDPRRDAPFALFAGLAVVVLVYLSMQLVFMGAISDPAALARPEVRERPVAEAARLFLGAGGVGLIALGVMLSTYGNLAVQFVGAPRLLFALAEQRDFPAILTRVHRAWRTPHVAILTHAACSAAFAIYGSFIWNAILSAVARLGTYAVVCAAVPILRRRDSEGALFRLPGGWLLPAIGLSFCVVLGAQMQAAHARLAAIVAVLATMNWIRVRR